MRRRRALPRGRLGCPLAPFGRDATRDFTGSSKVETLEAGFNAHVNSPGLHRT